MGAKIQAFHIFQTPLSSHYPLPLNKSPLCFVILNISSYWHFSAAIFPPGTLAIHHSAKLLSMDQLFYYSLSALLCYIKEKRAQKKEQEVTIGQYIAGNIGIGSRETFATNHFQLCIYSIVYGCNKANIDFGKFIVCQILLQTEGAAVQFSVFNVRRYTVLFKFP